MLVVIDVGNTNTKFAICENGEILRNWKVSTCARRAAAEYFTIIRTLAAEYNLDITKVSDAAVSSVVPSINFAITELFENFFNITPVLLGGEHAKLLGLKVSLVQEFIGSDRLADLVAARTLWPNRDLLVVDMGTITVFNLLDCTGNIYGQVLAPGLSCLVESIRTQTSLLPQVRIQKTGKIVSNSTASSLESGVYWGFRSMVEGIIKQVIHEEKGKKLHVIATGGGANLMHDCVLINCIDSLLTIKGILYVLEKTKKLRA